MKKLLWVLILLLLPLTALAEDAESRRDGAFFYQIADGEAILTGCDWDAMQADSLYMFAEPQVSLEIPATLGGYPVTSIGGWVFCSLDGCPVDAPFEVVLPEGLRALDADTFADCFYAANVTLPATLEIIPEDCFDRISAEIEFPNGNPRYSCENGFLIDNTTQTLLYTAPSSHGNPLPAVRRLGDCSLMNWLWYDDDDPVLPDTLESVGSYIFYDCGVTRVTFPDGITELSPYTFYCTDLQEVHLPASLREIPDYCFWNCQLIALTIPDGVTRIGAHAVDWFTGEIIGAVTLPASVEFVGYRAFPDECDVTALNPQVHFETATEYAERIPEYDWYGDEAADALYSDGLFDYELSSRGAVLLDCSRFLNQPEVPDVLEIPSELGGTPVVAIAANALNTSESCADSLLFGIVLPEGVQRVEADAFQCCHAATQISFPSTLTMLAEGSFFHVYAEIDFPNGNPRYSCENGFLIDNTTQTLLYTAPSSHGTALPAVRRLGDWSLANWLWYDDDDPVLPDTLESVGSHIFYDCCVTRVTFPDGITELSPYTFHSTDLQEVHLPASLREIPDHCFWNCQLTALTIPDGVTRIGAHAFDGFTGEIIGAVTLPASVEFVGYRAFPDECDVTALNPQVHFETVAEYALYSDGLFDYELSSRGAVLLGCSRFFNQPEVPDVLEIPAKLGGYPVVGLGAYALCTYDFADVRDFSIIVPEGVRFMTSDAFLCCHAATRISFPSTLDDLPENSFYQVSAEIDFPNGNPRYSCENGFLIDRDTQTLLYAAPSSQGQPIPAVRRLGDSALDNWKPAGNEIRLPDTLESIGPYALYGQYTDDFSPLAALILPDGIRELSECSIYAGREIQLLRFPATLTEIPAYCVANCGLGAVEIPEGVTRIGEFAFYYYDWEQTELSAVTLPASVEFVGFRAFPDECEITALNPDTHFETEEEINQRNPDWAYRIP